jgi:hypothetical protein
MMSLTPLRIDHGKKSSNLMKPRFGLIGPVGSYEQFSCPDFGRAALACRRQGLPEGVAWSMPCCCVLGRKVRRVPRRMKFQQCYSVQAQAMNGWTISTGSSSLNKVSVQLAGSISDPALARPVESHRFVQRLGGRAAEGRRALTSDDFEGQRAAGGGEDLEQPAVVVLVGEQVRPVNPS